MSCHELRDLAPELALGIADGEERAEALRHLADCGECRRLVEQMAGVADELLMLAPAQEPPAGFESRVLEGLGLGGAPKRRRTRRLALRVAAPVAAAAVTAGILVGVYHDDHVTASRYRGALAEAGGSYFDAQALRDPGGARAGVAFTYAGRPSWLLVTVDRGHRREVASAELVTRGGRRIRLPRFRLRPDGTWGGGIPVKLHEVSAVRLLGRRPGEVLQAGPRRDEH